ncbi:hypothetical protein V8E53_011613 [Lactarius tabidus]
MPSTTFRETSEEAPLDEQYVQDAFHSYLESSLAQAKAERLLDAELLSSAEGDLMIAVCRATPHDKPSLCTAPPTHSRYRLKDLPTTNALPLQLRIHLHPLYAYPPSMLSYHNTSTT